MSAEYYDTGILLKLYTIEPESQRVRNFVGEFITSDQRQAALAHLCGLRVVDPIGK